MQLTRRTHRHHRRRHASALSLVTTHSSSSRNGTNGTTVTSGNRGVRAGRRCTRQPVHGLHSAVHARGCEKGGPVQAARRPYMARADRVTAGTGPLIDATRRCPRPVLCTGPVIYLRVAQCLVYSLSDLAGVCPLFDLSTAAELGLSVSTTRPLSYHCSIYPYSDVCSLPATCPLPYVLSAWVRHLSRDGRNSEK